VTLRSFTLPTYDTPHNSSGGRWVLVGSSIGDDGSKGLVLCNGGGS
jgi:hypothetical protein